MKALIIEDEKAAVRNLKALLTDVEPDMDIIAVTDSIIETIEWFKNNPVPDLVFMDIHLADGSAFEIFEHISVPCPIIFTTAYDEYAMKAFKVNSIDYLLKPIGVSDIQKSLLKLELLRVKPQEEQDFKSLIQVLKQETKYKSHFLVPIKGDKLLPIAVDSILYFFIENGLVKAVVAEDKEYVLNQTLDELTDCLDPAIFFRVNRQYLISRKAIQDIDLWFNSRLSINLKTTAPERILVSKVRVAEFKEWFTS